MGSKKILIIGGGLTGLVAARELASSGCKVSLVESGDCLGGLAASCEVNGEAVEKAYHHIFRTDKEIINLIGDLGLDHLLEWKESSVAIFRGKKMWSFMTPFDLLRFKPCSLLGRIRLGLAALHIKYAKNWRRFAKSTAMEWMEKTVGKSAVASVWRPLLKGKFSHFAEDISMAWLWARLHVRSNSREPGGGKEHLGYIKGGFIQLINALEKELLSQGVNIFLRSRVSELAETQQGGISVQIDSEEHTFDQVLFTGSNKSFASFLPQEEKWLAYREKLREVDYLGAVCLLFSTPQKLGDYYWVNVNEEDAPFLVFIRHTKLIAPSRYQGEEVYYIGAYCSQEEGLFCQSNEDIRKQWFDYLKVMCPDFDASAVRSEQLFKFADAQHVVKLGYEEKIPDHETPMKGLFLSNFTQIYPEDRGTNFAVREGKKIASIMQG